MVYGAACGSLSSKRAQGPQRLPVRQADARARKLYVVIPKVSPAPTRRTAAQAPPVGRSRPSAPVDCKLGETLGSGLPIPAAGGGARTRSSPPRCWCSRSARAGWWAFTRCSLRRGRRRAPGDRRSCSSARLAGPSWAPRSAVDASGCPGVCCKSPGLAGRSRPQEEVLPVHAPLEPARPRPPYTRRVTPAGQGTVTRRSAVVAGAPK